MGFFAPFQNMANQMKGNTEAQAEKAFSQFAEKIGGGNEGKGLALMLKKMQHDDPNRGSYTDRCKHQQEGTEN